MTPTAFDFFLRCRIATYEASAEALDAALMQADTDLVEDAEYTNHKAERALAEALPPTERRGLARAAVRIGDRVFGTDRSGRVVVFYLAEERKA